jgi:hypothetical protein
MEPADPGSDNKPFIGMKMTFGEPLTSASFAGALSKLLSSSLRPI